MIQSFGRHERKKAWEAITRRAIVDAAVRVISKSGVEGLKMETVAREAGVAKGTLYQYFKDKQDLLRSTMEASVGPLFDKIHAVLESGISPKEKLTKFIYMHLGYFEEHRQLFRILLYDRHFVQSRCKRYGSERYRAFLDRIALVLEEGMKNGDFRQANPLSLAAILMESNIAMINQRLLAEHPSTVSQDCKLIESVFFRGILAKQ
jgi:AcrR family transcriptional regulator